MEGNRVCSGARDSLWLVRSGNLSWRICKVSAKQSFGDAAA